jgi:DnaK suppressor protein
MMIEELAPPTMHELRAQLERQRAELKDQIRAQEDAQGTNEPRDPVFLGGPDTDIGDLSAQRASWDYSRAVLMSLRQHLANVERALTKFDKGTYGLCEDCGRLIPTRRLQRIPEARYDVEHQARHEARERFDTRLRTPA